MVDLLTLLLMLFYIVTGLLGLASVCIEFKYHRAKWNTLKMFFYSIFFLHNLTRSIVLGWDLEDYSKIQSSSSSSNSSSSTQSTPAIWEADGIQFYTNFPALIFISYAGLIALQMIQFSTSETVNLSHPDGRFRERNWFWVKWGSNILITLNLVMYFTAFLLFGLAEKGIGSNQQQAKRVGGSKQSIVLDLLEYFFFVNLLIVLLSHCLVCYKTFWRFRNIFGSKLNLIHISLICTLGARSILLLLNPTSINISFSINQETRSNEILSFFYFTIGEILPSLFILSIQFLLPYHDESYTSLANNEENWKIKSIKKIKTINNGGSGAMVYLCRATMNDNTSKDLAGKCINTRESQPIEIEKIRNEVTIYQSIYSNHILKYYSTHQEAGELIVLLEYMPYTLEQYILARSVCETKIGLESFLKHTDRYANNSVNVPHKPYYLSCSEFINLFHSISLAMQYLHTNRIIHRDLKPGNIFISLSSTYHLMECKVGDFDNSIMLDNNNNNNNNNIINPIINCLDYDPYFKLDVYNFGMIMYNVMTLNIEKNWCAYHPNLPIVAPEIPEQDLSYLNSNLLWNDILTLYRDCTQSIHLNRPQASEIRDRLEDIKSKL